MLENSVSFLALGTINSITIYDLHFDSEALIKSQFSVEKISNKLSVFSESSEVFKINENAGKNATKVSDETFYIIKKAVEFSKKLNGTFDITVFPLVNFWRECEKKNQYPAEKQIEIIKNLVNYNDIVLNEKEKTVFLKREKQGIDLGSIAKGYCADLVKDILVLYGVKNAIINLGGNIIVLGKDAEKKTFNVGLQKPNAKRGEYFCYLPVKNKSVVTSGGYERFFLINNNKYNHIINPQNGYPINNGIASVSVITKSSMKADAISTALYVLGIERGFELLKHFRGIEAVVLNKNGEIFQTDGMSKYLKGVK